MLTLASSHLYWLFKLVATLCLGSSVLLGLMAPSFFTLWIMMEINLISFLMVLYFSSLRVSKLINYFLIQALASGLLICLYFTLWNLKGGLSTLLVIPLLVKLGSAPFHLWLIKIMKTLTWIQIWTISVWQKILPMMALILLNHMHGLIMFLGGVNCLLSGALIPQQTYSLKTLFVFSSIFSLGWIMVSIGLSSMMWAPMLLSYGGGLLMLVCLWEMKLAEKNDTMYSSAFSMGAGLLMISGVPPFPVFWAKLVIIFSLLPYSIALGFFMLIISLWVLYMYITILLGISMTLLPSFIKEDLIKAPLGMVVIVNILPMGVFLI